MDPKGEPLAATKDAQTRSLGCTADFFLTAGPAHDLVGADCLLNGMDADALIAEKAYAAGKRVIEPLAVAGKVVVIRPKANRKAGRDYNRDLYKVRYLVENCFIFTSPQSWFGLMDDTH